MAKLPVTMPAQNLIAMSTLNLNTHTLQFRALGDGLAEVFHSEQVKYTFPITYPDPPIVDGYTFREWESTMPTMPNFDFTVNALMDKVRKKITARISYKIPGANSDFAIETLEGTTWGEYIGDGLTVENPYDRSNPFYLSISDSGSVVLISYKEQVRPLLKSVTNQTEVTAIDFIESLLTYGYYYISFV